MKCDWKLLREQKNLLLVLVQGGRTSVEEAHLLDGVVNLIDVIQDAALDSGEVTELEVFGTEQTQKGIEMTPDQGLIDAAIEQIKIDVADGDLSAIEELLQYVPEQYLQGFLSDIN